MKAEEYFEKKIKEIEEQQEKFAKLPPEEKVNILAKQLALAESVISAVAKGFRTEKEAISLICLARDYIRGKL